MYKYFCNETPHIVRNRMIPRSFEERWNVVVLQCGSRLYFLAVWFRDTEFGSMVRDSCPARAVQFRQFTSIEHANGVNSVEFRVENHLSWWEKGAFRLWRTERHVLL